MENILVIGIAGGSGSGKSTLTKNLISAFGDVITRVREAVRVPVAAYSVRVYNSIV